MRWILLFLTIGLTGLNAEEGDHPRFAPRVTQLTQEADCLRLKVEFPGFFLRRRAHPLAGAFLQPVLPDAGITAPLGAPLLPAWRRLLSVPPDAEVRFSVKARPSRPIFLEARYQVLYPRQRPRPKSPSAKGEPFDFDLVTYSANAWFPDQPARLLEAGRMGGQRMILLELFPLRYHPRSLTLAGFSEFEVELRFRRPDPPLHLSPSIAAAARADPETKTTPRLLVLAPVSFHHALSPLIAHREQQGWTVDLATPPSTSPPSIRAWITNRYARAETRPDALLLVGDTEQIPCFSGTQLNRPDTDLYYACMDGPNDWQPDFPVGRLSAPTPDDVTAMIEKSITVETAPPEAWFLETAFLAGTDQASITEGTHEAVIDDWLDPNGYRADRLYVSRFGATTADAGASFNAGRLLGVYSGHGSEHEWSDGPRFQKIHVLALTNENRYPIVLSFACLTGRFGGVPECFAETWQRAPQRGASAIVASSVTSYWDEDDVLERAFFEAVFGENRRTVGEALVRAKARLIEHYGLTATVRRYFEQYNLLGDPLTPIREPRLTIATGSDLPTARVGEPFEWVLRAAGGQKPYRWAVTEGSMPGGLTLDSESGRIFGWPSEAATGHTFLVEVQDALGVSTSRLFRLHIAGEPLRLASGLEAGPFPAGQFFRHSLEAAGGIGPYRWALRHPGRYACWTNSGFWARTPKASATGRRGDDEVWRLTLPWPFPFYGRAYRRLFISSNGYLDFRTRGSDWDNTLEGLVSNARIAPLWDDLVLTNLYVSVLPFKVIVRWTGRTFQGRIPVDFQATLQSNGRILFAYRQVSGASVSPTIGISAGDGEHYVLAPLDGWSSIPRGLGVKFAPRPTLPEGVTLSEDGTLSGQVAATGEWAVAVTVTDSSIPSSAVSGVLTLGIE